MVCLKTKSVTKLLWAQSTYVEMEKCVANLKRATYLDGYFSRPELDPCESIVQGVRERTPTTSDGFTAKGMVAILANQLHDIHSTLIRVRTELSQNAEAVDGHQRPDDYIVNGLLASAITGLQSIQDGIASFCHHEVPDVLVTGPCYFSTYPFAQTDFEIIAHKKAKLYSYHFGGKNINDLANHCRHELPWLGHVVGVRIQDGEYAYYVQDIADNKRTALFRHVVLPVFQETKGIIACLARRYDTHVDVPPV
jgi:hypothetical protein